jgi:hypothetical protein
VLAVYEDGLASTDGLGRLAHRIPWNQVIRLRYQGRAQLTYDEVGRLVRPHEDQYRLETQGAPAAVFVMRYPLLVDLGHEMSTVLLEGVSTAQLPGGTAAIHNGETLQFGSVSVDRHGLIRRRFRMEWPEIDDLQICVGSREDIRASIGRLQSGPRPGVAKTKRSSEAIVGGVTGSLSAPETVLLGRFDGHCRLRFVGRSHPLTAIQQRGPAPALGSVSKSVACR